MVEGRIIRQPPVSTTGLSCHEHASKDLSGVLASGQPVSGAAVPGRGATAGAGSAALTAAVGTRGQECGTGRY